MSLLLFCGMWRRQLTKKRLSLSLNFTKQSWFSIDFSSYFFLDCCSATVVDDQRSLRIGTSVVCSLSLLTNGEIRPKKASVGLELSVGFQYSFGVYNWSPLWIPTRRTNTRRQSWSPYLQKKLRTQPRVVQAQSLHKRILFKPQKMLTRRQLQLIFVMLTKNRMRRRKIKWRLP